VDLDLTPFLPAKESEASLGLSQKGSALYDLFAVSDHSGSLSGGHYTAICRNPIDNKWYDFNDSYVSSSSEERVVSPEAYLLFYRQKAAAGRSTEAN